MKNLFLFSALFVGIGAASTQAASIQTAPLFGYIPKEERRIIEYQKRLAVKGYYGKCENASAMFDNGDIAIHKETNQKVRVLYLRPIMDETKYTNVISCSYVADHYYFVRFPDGAEVHVSSQQLTQG